MKEATFYTQIVQDNSGLRNHEYLAIIDLSREPKLATLKCHITRHCRIEPQRGARRSPASKILGFNPRKREDTRGDRIHPTLVLKAFFLGNEPLRFFADRSAPFLAHVPLPQMITPAPAPQGAANTGHAK